MLNTAAMVSFASLPPCRLMLISKPLLVSKPLPPVVLLDFTQVVVWIRLGEVEHCVMMSCVIPCCCVFKNRTPCKFVLHAVCLDVKQ